jgi:hypothetical protein
MGLQFIIAAGPRQRNQSQVRLQRDSWPHFTVSNSRLPQPGGPGPRIYILQEQGGPVIPPGTELPFRRLLRLAGLRRRYWSPPPNGIPHVSESESESESYVTTDGQSASLCWNKAPICGLRPDFYYCQTVAVCWCGALSLTRGRVCRLQLLLELASVVILATIFYCLRFETSLFVASYDSQGYGGGIRPRLLHTGCTTHVSITTAMYTWDQAT